MSCVPAFASDDKQAKSIRIGIFDGNPYYIAMTGLKYNDWHLVVCLKADRAFAIPSISCIAQRPASQS